MYESSDTQNVDIINNIKKELYTQGCHVHASLNFLVHFNIKILPKSFFMQWKLTLGRNLLEFIKSQLNSCHDKADNKQSLLTNMPPK